MVLPLIKLSDCKNDWSGINLFTIRNGNLRHIRNFVYCSIPRSWYEWFNYCSICKLFFKYGVVAKYACSIFNMQSILQVFTFKSEPFCCNLFTCSTNMWANLKKKCLMSKLYFLLVTFGVFFDNNTCINTNLICCYVFDQMYFSGFVS